MIRPDQPHGRHYFVIWGLLCLLSSVPGIELWLHRGGVPNNIVSWSALGAATVGILTLIFSARSYLRTSRASQLTLHLSAETGVTGGALEGAISGAANDLTECIIRLVCEKHDLRVKKTHDGSRHSHEVTAQYKDLYRSEAQHGMLPIRFGIPFDSPQTSVEWTFPLHLWFIELEGLDDQLLARFWVPVFRTPASHPDFQLGPAAADRLTSDESPVDCLARHGIKVTHMTGQPMTLEIPAGHSWTTAIWLSILGVACLAVAGFSLSRLAGLVASLRPAVDVITVASVISILGTLVFVIVFGLFGLLFVGITFQALFERRRVECDRSEVRIHHSYFGFGWTTSIQSQAIQELVLTHSSSVSGRRKMFMNVVATTNGMLRRDGSTMVRRRTIVGSVPREAAEAARLLLENAMTE